jgi:hypothetical protein
MLQLGYVLLVNSVVEVGMKLTIFGLVLFGMVVGTYAKWRPLNEQELISSSDLIVIAEFQSLSETQEKLHISQRATFAVSKVIRGNAVSSIEVAGTTARICAPVVRFTGEESGSYLLLLRKREDVFAPVNGFLSLLKIEEEGVPWFIQEEEETYSYQRELAPLDQVLARIIEIASSDKN